MSETDRRAARLESRTHDSPGILLYGMYALRHLDRAPEVRIVAMTEALARQVRTERIVGGRLGRVWAGLRWLLGGGPRRVRAVYVEAPTTNAMPTDLLFLAFMRLLRKPVGVYFRDAYQLFRDVHPRRRRTQFLTDWLWRLSHSLLKKVGTVHYAPTEGLARALKLSNAVPLPPGTDPLLPDLGVGEKDLVVAIVQPGARTGFDRLVEAVAVVRETRSEARLRIGVRRASLAACEGLPEWVETVPADEAILDEVLRPGRVCVLPLAVTAYTQLAVPVRLLRFLSLGKPVVATETAPTRAILEESAAGIATPDTAAGLASGISRILGDDALAHRMARNARAFAVSEAQTWDARAATVLDTLGVLSNKAGANAHEEPVALARARNG